MAWSARFGFNSYVLLDSYALLGWRLPPEITLGQLECRGGVAQW